VPIPEALLLALMDRNPAELGLVLAFLVLSLGIHEAAHAWVALRCGDTTARDLGRITLNPLPHIDPFMSILMPLMMLLSTGGRFVFGGARPVPVNYYNLRNPLRDMALVAIAGPASNVLLAAVFFLSWKVVVEKGELWRPENTGSIVLLQAMQLNLLLAAFNMLPIPPLDGSRVMTWLLPGGLRESYAAFERWGIYLVVILVWFVPPVRVLMWGTVDAMETGIKAIVNLGGAW